MFALTFTRNPGPVIIGSDPGWFTFGGMVARPRATSARTVSGSTSSRRVTNSISAVMVPPRA
jgi:hypothetical protein